MKPDKPEKLIFEANMDAGLRAYFRRTGAEAVYETMPFDDMLQRESDGLDHDEEDAIGEYEMRQRLVGVRAFLRYIKSRGLDPASVMRQLWAAGRAVQDDYFGGLTMTEAAKMFGETKAAHSFRCKVLSGEIKLAGMHGVRLPGQKSPEASESYRKAAKGNTNRKNGKKRRKASPSK